MTSAPDFQVQRVTSPESFAQALQESLDPVFLEEVVTALLKSEYERYK